MKIEATAVPLVERLAFLPKLFGPNVMMYAESMLYNCAKRLAPDEYRNGSWEFYELSNGGGYAAPMEPQQFNLMIGSNGFEGGMSNDAAGIVFTLFVINSLCFRYAETDPKTAEKFVDHYHQLLDFAKQHKEARSIFRAID
ncbi:antirestriction protein [Paraburkholderia sp. BR10936]|uniref:antirestriction protein n=1 Tax=Paraburkholderia sp. BR10936 TaxID=3236993 RepID=UPI0034D3735D